MTYEGQTYKTVIIGKQTWIAENLNVKTENWPQCYDDDDDNCKKYGRLYNWNTAKSACPKGWHLPDTAEWSTLIKMAGGRELAGKKLKSKSGWNDQKDGTSGNGMDEFGFSALPGSRYAYDDGNINYGHFTHCYSSCGYWWSATEWNNDDGYAYGQQMREGKDGVDEDPFMKEEFFSVRCVKD